MRTHYSQNLVNLVLDMLIIDEAQRPSIVQILNYPAIKPYINKVSLAGKQSNIGSNSLTNSRSGFFKNSGNKFSRSESKPLLTPFRSP